MSDPRTKAGKALLDKTSGGWRSDILAIEAEAASPATGEGLRADIAVNWLGEPICARCQHAHSDAPWVETDPDDGTCWATQGPLVCGCSKFITQDVQDRAVKRRPATTPDTEENSV